MGEDCEEHRLVLDCETLDTLFVKPAFTKRTKRRPIKQQLNGAGLLERQRSTNIEIGLRRVTQDRSIEQIVSAIMRCNSDSSDGGLSEEMLAALIETLPTQDEMSALNKYAVMLHMTRLD